MISANPVHETLRPGLELRKAERAPCRRKAICHLTFDDNRGAFAGRIVDISAGGIGLVLNRKVEADSQVRVRLPTSDTPREFPVQVIHVTKLAPGWWLMGGAFTQRLDAADLHTLLS